METTQVATQSTEIKKVSYLVKSYCIKAGIAPRDLPEVCLRELALDLGMEYFRFREIFNVIFFKHSRREG